MRTGEDVLELGLYSSECCLQEVFFDTGDAFSRCPRCSNLSIWEKVDVSAGRDEVQILKSCSGIESRWPKHSDAIVPELRRTA